MQLDVILNLFQDLGKGKTIGNSIYNKFNKMTTSIILLSKTLTTLSSAYNVINEKLNYDVVVEKIHNKFIKDFKDNISFFKEELFQNEHFVSCLVLTYNEMIKQRHEWKRDRIFGIFWGFVSENDKEKFELEKMYHVLNLMSLEDFNNLKIMFDRDKGGRTGENKQFVKTQTIDEYILSQFLISMSIAVNRSDYMNSKNAEYSGINKLLILTDFGLSFIKNLFENPQKIAAQRSQMTLSPQDPETSSG